ncbi:glycosyltransferase [Agromyces sp. NPDC056379]|uniref:glycosyltransferase n=1 Tax=unclassified Agromyces TaxID=2639701 RepID=UPI0035DD5047
MLRVDDATALEGVQIDGTVVALPTYVGLAAMVRRLPRLVMSVDRAVRNSDVTCVKLPGIIGLIAVWRAYRRRRPIAAQVVGDIDDVLRTGVAGKVGSMLAPLAVRLTRRAIRRADTVRYVTEQSLQRKYPARTGAVRVAYTDVRAEPIAVPGSRVRIPGRIIAVGSQEQLYKGHQVLVDAVAALVRDGIDAQLDLVGDGRRQPELSALVGSLGIAGRVRFLGHIDDRSSLLALLDQAEVFAMPSLTEGLPRALIEAMARGLPCIGSDVGGIPELLPRAALVPPGDVIALTRKLRRVLTDRSFQADLEAAAIESAERFKPEALERRRQIWSASVGALVSGRGSSS